MFARSSNLQEMCLTAVVKNIDFFIYDKTIIPERHISFLFHVYSEEVFSMHKTMKSSITEDCMMWFLHSRVRKVNLRTFHSERIITQLKEIGSGITSLNLHKSVITEKELNSIIPFIPNVVNLDLSETACSDQTLTCIINSCSNIESLNVSCCEGVTDTGMYNLCGSKLLLKNLNTLYTSVDDEGLFNILNEMPSLECLTHEDLTTLLDNCSHDSREYNLTELICGHFDISVGTIKAWVKMCPKLKKLHFKLPVDKKILSACTHFNNLEELKIKMSHKRYVNIEAYDVLTAILPISQNLKTLILSCVKISALMLVECFKNLKNLYLKNVSFMPFKSEDVKIRKTNLSTLVIHDIRMQVNDVNYQGVALLISLSNDVTELHLKHIDELPTQILDVVLGSMRNLALVNFNSTLLNVHSLDPFFEIPSMRTVFANHLNETDLLYPINQTFPRNESCTLAWRYMHNEDDGDDGEILTDSDNDTKYCYYDDSDESDGIISDRCNSTDSDSDDYYFHMAYYDDMDDMYESDPDLSELN